MFSDQQFAGFCSILVSISGKGMRKVIASSLLWNTDFYFCKRVVVSWVVADEKEGAGSLQGPCYKMCQCLINSTTHLEKYGNNICGKLSFARI